MFSIDLSVIIPLLAGLAIAIAWAVSAHGKRRREAFQRIARQRGLSYAQSADSHEIEGFRGFPLFSKGSGSMVRNLIRGNVGRAHLHLFDYSYRQRTGQSFGAVRQTVFTVSSDRLDMPVCSMYPRSFFSLIGNILGKNEVDVSSNQVFSKAYVLKGDDEEAIREMFPDPVLRYFEKHQGLTLECSGHRFICYRFGRMAQPETVGRFLNEGLEILRFFE